MGKVVKYKSRVNGQILNELDLSGVKWGDGSEMTVEECFKRFPKAYELIEETVITDQERDEIFDFAKELIRSAYLGGQSMSPDYAITKSIELYKLKETI
jgi:hypothetical protein